jgi:hypothetical protein
MTMALNIRKAICRGQKPGSWLFKACDCQRYEKTVTVCKKSGMLPGEFCTEYDDKVFYFEPAPTTICDICEPEPVFVEIDVCEKTAWLPGKYCKTVKRTFLESEVPTATCIACKCQTIPTILCSVSDGLMSDNCRASHLKDLCVDEWPERCLTCFPDKQQRGALTYGMLDLFGDLKFIYPRLDGSWQFDEQAFRAHLAPIIGAGADSIRAFGWSVFGPQGIPRSSQFQAFKLTSEESAWDLDIFNDYYFPICRRAIEIVNSLGAAFLFDWIDQCQIQQGFWRYLSPWCHNIQGGGDFYDSKIWPQVKAFMLRCIDEFKGLNVIWGFNETDWDAFVGFAKNVYFPVIQERNLDFNRLSNGSVGKMPAYDPTLDAYAFTIDTQHWVRYWAEKIFGEYNVLCWLRWIHGTKDTLRPGFVDAFLAAWGNHPIRVGFSDDGQNPRPDAAAWYEISKMAFSYRSEGSWEGKPIRRCINLEHCGETEDVPTLVAIFRAMKKGMDQL